MVGRTLHQDGFGRPPRVFGLNRCAFLVVYREARSRKVPITVPTVVIAEWWALEPMGLGFIPFLVLAATHVLVRRAGDAVSQQVVADYLVLDKARVSDAMRELESRGWISRGPSFPVGAWRVLISGNGRRVLRVTAKSLGDPSGGTG